MGDLRNIKRTYCFGRALQKFNKKSTLRLTPSNVFILMALYDQGQPVTINELREYLRKGKHLYRHTLIRDRCILFTGHGWVSGSEEQRYRITEEGKSALMALEDRIRNERADK